MTQSCIPHFPHPHFRRHDSAGAKFHFEESQPVIGLAPGTGTGQGEGEGAYEGGGYDDEGDDDGKGGGAGTEQGEEAHFR